MNNPEIIIYLLPFIFIIHDFEEIIGFKAWFTRNGEWLTIKYPGLEKQVRHFEQLSTAAFAFAVLEEFIIIAFVTIYALLFQWYYAWIAIFTVFEFHIIVHIIQWLIAGRYIPVIITSLLSVPYIILGMNMIFTSFSLFEILICFLTGLPIAIINLLTIHKLMTKLDKHLKNGNTQ